MSFGVAGVSIEGGSISDVQLIKAEGLDINGADTEEILCRAENEIDRLFDNRV